MERRNRLVRIFVSSTFQDMELERNALQMHVVPRMQQWCQERGWQFETVDLRWGINEEASQAHRTMSICLEELANCRRLSPKPHLLLLLGERYGWLPLPERLSQEEMQRLMATATQPEQALLERAYRLEGNLYPASYQLAETPADEAALRDMMMRYCQQSGDKAFYEQHLISATEQEIQQGLLSHTELFDQVVTYERRLTGLPEQEKIRYTDTAHKAELQLLRKKVNDVVPQRNIIEREVDYDAYDSEAYARWFADEVTERLQALVEEEMSTHNIDEYEEERLNQQAVVEEAAGNYQPRKDEVERILNALQRGEDGRLCVVRGVSGAGLTTLAAHICHRLAASGERLINRFVGIGQMSSSGLLLLRTLLREVGEEFDDSDSVFDLMAKWRIYLEECSQRTIFVIDGLDRLDTDDWVRGLQWLPTSLSANLNILLTVGDDNLTSELERFQPIGIQLPDLAEEQFIDALIGDLHLRNRQLTAGQTEVMRRVYNNVKSPIARRPLVALAARWSDKDTPSMEISGLQELMDTYLDGLIVSDYHDRHFLGLALGLLCFCRHGVSEQEILEIIATDERFYSHLQEHSHHRIVESGRPKVPFIFWSRLHHDIGMFLVLRRNKSSITYVFANKTIEHCVERWIDRQYPTMRHDVVALASNYFELLGGNRFYEEMPYMLENLADESRQTKLMASEELMLGKCGADMVDDLIADYDQYLRRHPHGAATDEVKQRRLFLQKNHQMITTYAKYGTDVILSLWEQDMPATTQGQPTPLCTGKARTTIHIPGSIITAAANDDSMVVCHTPPSGTSDTYMECFLTDRVTRETQAFALLPLGWGRRPPSNAILSNDSKLALLFSFEEESCILWHTDTGVVEYRKKEELWDMAILPDNTVCYLSRTELRTIDDEVLCSFDSALGIDANQKRLICQDPSRNILYIVVSDRKRHFIYHLDTHETEVVDNGDAYIAYIIGYDPGSASLLYREDDDDTKSIYRYLLRENKSISFPLQPENYIHSATIVNGRWLAYIDNQQIVSFDMTTNQTILSDEGCDANRIYAFGTHRTFLTSGCYELKEWEISE